MSVTSTSTSACRPVKPSIVAYTPSIEVYYWLLANTFFMRATAIAAAHSLSLRDIEMPLTLTPAPPLAIEGMPLAGRLVAETTVGQFRLQAELLLNSTTVVITCSRRRSLLTAIERSGLIETDVDIVPLTFVSPSCRSYMSSLLARCLFCLCFILAVPATAFAHHRNIRRFDAAIKSFS